MTVSASRASTVSLTSWTLPRTDEGAGVRLAAALDQAVDDFGAGRLGELRELREGVLGVVDGAFGPDADEDDAFEAQSPVFGIGDVRELGGREAGDAAQCLAGFQVQLPRGGGVGGRKVFVGVHLLFVHHDKLDTPR